MKYLLLLSTVLLLGQSAFASETKPKSDDFYCKQRGLGDYFYCKPPEPEKKPKVIPKPVKPKPPAKDKDIAELEVFQKELDDARKKAVWNPTSDNVRNFMQLQIVMADRADKFSSVFTQLGWQEPELSYNVKNPVTRAGLQSYRQQERLARNDHMKMVKDRYGIYYFYAQSCAACDVFSPILQMFASIHDVEVVAVSMDGGPSKVFKDWRYNNGIARRLGLSNTITPAVILYDIKKRETIPVSFGVISVEDLEDRIFELTGGEQTGYIGEKL